MFGGNLAEDKAVGASPIVTKVIGETKHKG